MTEPRRQGATTDSRSQGTKPRRINILQWNAEGVYQKKTSLEERLRQEDIEIACLQETHLKENQRFNVRGYQTFRQDRVGRSKGGIALLVKNTLSAKEFSVSTNDQTEIQGVNIVINNQQMEVVNLYSPPDRDLSLDQIQVQDSMFIAIGDFNSHSEAWGYKEADRRGEEVEDWQIENKLVLLNDPDDPPTFYSRRWMTCTTPDLAFATNDIARITTRTVLDQLAGSDHRPVKISLDLDYKPQESKTCPRWNYKRAKWEKFSQLTDEYTQDIRIKNQDINKKIRTFNQVILKAAKETIPRGARKDYKPYWTEEFQELEDAVTEAREQAEEDPTEENNIALKAATAKHRQTFIQEARKSWVEKTENLNLDKDGKKLWKLARTLNDEDTKSKPFTLEQEGNLISGKQAADIFIAQYSETSDLQVPNSREKEVKESLQPPPSGHERGIMNAAFTKAELEEALSVLKMKKAPGPDNITNEMLTHLGPKSKKKILQIFNDGWKAGSVPQIWREAIMIPVHKKGKDRAKAESYRPISLTSCVGKLMERIINKRLVHHLE